MKAFYSWAALGAAGLALLLTACDSTPRERQAVARQELAKLDTAARNGGRTLHRLGRQAVAYDAANRARRATPLSPREQRIMDQQLLGGYADHIGELTVQTIAGAYGELLRATRVRQGGWQLRDWDYAQNTYQRLNQQLARIRLDLPARSEVRIRAWQAEFVALRARRTAKDLQTATKQDKND
ncbi:hypothetical protein HHL22_11330 [Hymenobacter sp. RP-2-7]|uniref:DUF4142 domain-containing protein n=1 Tax=Hymenobacter polaris TaxID=2682546 RepID=A0A7Y0AEF0_9BACT|nr:hypothetical protein [Hymenobacter polaris]NML65797.1 hypothetical protein [Hymenobacter polaris]